MPVTRLGPCEACHLLARGEVDLVDVRELREWLGGRIPGARLVPLGRLVADPRAHCHRDGILFVCAHGVRSLEAAAVAEGAGFSQVYSLDGGLAAWTAEGFPVERG
ncbi:rhodanese-like domain-containing protein [Anaeromyxobacter paludicola]|uniref:Sulfurtransferase n=1 Tax=Anaeromyxobacter paludicola TaxID=2918171 RepID=A0ABM7XBV9_9BACT|nr:rhodanese-like domain-containing protein [Anaeromyxobacter paludicola]BDG09345.1 sulfurtransferase [Anaeromyxobacter paludicola]